MTDRKTAGRMFGITHAPELERPGQIWFNTGHPLSLDELRGRLVILDFWTYCCINCLHTLPTLALVERAFPGEVAVVGVHSPKFDHESCPDSLANALARYDVRHPVVSDPGATLWEEYCIRAWPTLVFISPDGMIIGQISGEPDPELLLNGLGSMLEQFRREGQLCPCPLPLTTPRPINDGGRLRFPGKIKPFQGTDGRKMWVIADTGHHQIVLADDQGGEVARWGSGRPGFADGSAQADFNGPEGLACAANTIFVADTRNHAIRRIDVASGRVGTLAGDGRRGCRLPEEEGPPGTALASPWDLELVEGSLYFANAGTHQIGRVDTADGFITLAAGSGDEDMVDGVGGGAMLAQPSGLAALPGRGLVLADAETSAIRLFNLNAGGRIETIAGAGLFDFGHQDGALGQALFQHPLALACEGRRIAVADSYNNAVRLISLDDGTVTTLIASCQDAICRPLSEPAGIAFDGENRLLLSDTNNHRIVEIRLDTGESRTWMA